MRALVFMVVAVLNIIAMANERECEPLLDPNEPAGLILPLQTKAISNYNIGFADPDEHGGLTLSFVIPTLIKTSDIALASQVQISLPYKYGVADRYWTKEPILIRASTKRFEIPLAGKTHETKGAVAHNYQLVIELDQPWDGISQFLRIKSLEIRKRRMVQSTTVWSANAAELTLERSSNTFNWQRYKTVWFEF